MKPARYAGAGAMGAMACGACASPTPLLDARIAEDLMHAHLAQLEEDGTPADRAALRGLGFTDRQIADFGDAALAEARRRYRAGKEAGQ